MKVVPEILGQEQIADIKIHGFLSNMLWGIVFETEDEARQCCELLEELMKNQYKQ